MIPGTGCCSGSSALWMADATRAHAHTLDLNRVHQPIDHDHDQPAHGACYTFCGMATPKYKVSDKPVPVSELVDTLSDGTKVKRRVPRMRACNEKDAKGKLCAGHLKRWFFFGDEVKQKFGPEVEIYRCEHCKTLYLPSLEEQPRTGTLSW